ncbi:hypothetical protein EH223_11965 [candidate division KSB1 bacterium]|nr:hypothetical protein [candidate division KSB1 bacterium]RQW02712.1 MAG: hypothetical protein EH223_11965 [candidate division KSB1 bacterium]
MSNKKAHLVFFTAVYILLFLYLLFISKPSLLYFQFQPAFYFDTHFLSGLLIYPGGLADGLSLFFFQFFYQNFVGSLLLASLLLGIVLVFQAQIRILFQEKTAFYVTLIPLYFLILLYNDYNMPLVVALKFFLVLLAAVFYSRSGNVIRIALLCGLPVLYWIIGGWFCLFFVIIVLAVHLSTRTSLISFLLPALFFLTYCLSAFISARFIFQISLKEAFLYIIPPKFYYEPILFKITPQFFALFLSVPLLLLLWRIKINISKKFKRSEKSNFIFLYAPIITNIFAVLVLCSIMLLSLNRDEKRKIYISELAATAQWDKVLAEAKRVSAYDRIVEFQTNRAMCFAGCLLDSLFCIEHPVGVDGLFLDRIIASQIAMIASDLYFDLAHINAAQVMAYEYLTKFSYDPRAFKRLVLTNAINGQFSKAEKFLNLLQKSIVHKSWAKQHAFLLNEEKLLADPAIREKREFMAKRDFFLHSKSPNLDMLALLESNNHNKMAFEYLMAYYLLECKLGNVAAHLSMFKEFDYPSIPRHLQEAAIMYQSGARRIGSELIADFPVQVFVLNNFRQLNRIIAKNKYDAQKAMQFLKPEFGDTFWYYLISGGAERNDALKQRKVESLY